MRKLWFIPLLFLTSLCFAAAGDMTITTSVGAGSGDWTTTAGVSMTTPDNIGIGTTVPATLLDVNRLFNVMSAGNVGINTVAPRYKLETDGTLYGQGVYDNGNLVGAVKFASPTLSSASAFTISGLSPGVTYKFYLILLQNTSNGDQQFTFNGDTGNNYKENQIYQSAATAVSGYKSGAIASIFADLNHTAASGYVIYDITFQSYPGNNNAVIVSGQEFVSDSGGTWVLISFGGAYTGAAPLSSITVTDSAGTMTGTAALYKLQ